MSVKRKVTVPDGGWGTKRNGTGAFARRARMRPRRKWATLTAWGSNCGGRPLPEEIEAVQRLRYAVYVEEMDRYDAR